MIYRRFNPVGLLAIGTGGQQSRDIAQCNHMPGQWLLFGNVGQTSHLFDMGGPLDAPGMIPAGSTNSTEMRCGPWHLNDGRGRPCPSQTVTPRE